MIRGFLNNNNKTPYKHDIKTNTTIVTNSVNNTIIRFRSSKDLPIPVMSIKNCLDCSSSYLFTIDGYLVCSECGLVLKSDISEEADWNNYTDGKNNSRCGKSCSSEINPFINPLSTFLPKGSKSFVNKDGKYTECDISRLHSQNSYNHLQKSYNQVENTIDNCTHDRYSNNVIITTKKLWAEIMKSKKITRGEPRLGLIACCCYYACIFHSCPRSPIEICNDFGLLDTKNFNKGDKEFKEVFENQPEWSCLLTQSLDTENYFIRFCSKLESEKNIKQGTSFILTKKCKEFYDDIKEEFLDVFPKSAAGGVIYYVCKRENIPITKNRLSKCVGVCTPTLSKAVKSIEKILIKRDSLI